MTCTKLNILAVLAALSVTTISVRAGDQLDSFNSPVAVAIDKAITEQRYLDASNLLDQAFLSNGDDPSMIVLAGDLSLAKGDTVQAASTLGRIHSDCSCFNRAQEGLGIAESVLGHSDQAMPILLRVTANDPGAWRAWDALGSEYDRRHDWAKAEEAYSNALKGGSEIVFNNRGYSRLAQGHLDDAIGDFVSALNARPDFKQARTNLRLALAMKGDYARAVEGADANDQATLNNNAGFVALLKGDYQQARKLLSAAVNGRGAFYPVASENLMAAESLSKDSSAPPK